MVVVFFFQAEDGIRDAQESRGLGDVYKRQAIALTTDTSVITSIGNDYDFSEIFSKQIRAIGQPGDIAWGISTSGNSANVLKGLEVAKKMGLVTIAFTGKDGGDIAKIADLSINVSSSVTARIQ